MFQISAGTNIWARLDPQFLGQRFGYKEYDGGSLSRCPRSTLYPQVLASCRVILLSYIFPPMNPLQCILPVVDGLIPEYDALLQSMIFCAVNWLSLAKLHIHSESTLHLLTKVMKDYGRLTRQLAKDTVNVKMVETPREAEIRRRRKVPGSTATSEPGLKPKPITNSTFKLHNMTHYVWAIMFWGTPDSFTTAIVSSLSFPS